jgi:membrane protein DedA with SNARE-associated domain
MARYGARAVAAGRLIAGIRTKLAIVSGSTRMPFHRYLLADALGAAVWATLVGGLGYLFSSSVSTLIDRFGSASHVVGVIAIVVVAALVVYLSVRYVLRFRPAAA